MNQFFTFLRVQAAARIAFLLAFIAPATSLRADDIYIWAEETGGNVVFYFRGFIDLTGFPEVSGASLGAYVAPQSGVYTNGRNPLVPGDGYLSVMPGSAAQRFGTGDGAEADSDTGDDFGFDNSILVLPLGYTSGTLISGSMTFTGDTFASLGIDPTPKSFDTTVGTNTIFLFTRPPNSVLFAAEIAALQKKIRKFSKRVRKAKKREQVAKTKRLNMKVKKLKKKLRALR